MTRFHLTAVACLAFALVGSAADEPKTVKLVNGDGKVLAVENQSDDAEAKVVAVKDDPADKSQQWKVEKDGDHLKLTNRKSGKVLDVSGDSEDEDATIIQWDDKTEGTDNQRWSWTGDGKARRLKSKRSGHVLDVNDDGFAVQKGADEKRKAQLWEAVEVK